MHHPSLIAKSYWLYRHVMMDEKAEDLWMIPVLQQVSSHGSTLVPEIKTPIWVVVANIKGHERGGMDPEKRYQGTKVFSAKTKICMGLFYGGMGISSHVIGLSRNRRRLANCVVNLEMLEDVRPKLEYSRQKLTTLRELECMFFDSEDEAKAHADRIISCIEYILAKAQAKSL
jgi:hypothetical protein